MINSFGFQYTIENINEAYKQGLRNGKREAEQGLEEKLNKQYVKGETEGYNEGYQHGFTIAKGSITDLDKEEFENIIDDAFQEGYAQAYSELHAPITERDRQLQEKAWDDGYKEGESDTIEAMNELSRQQAEDWNECKHDSEDNHIDTIDNYFNDCREHHNPNKETQEAMQEVLDKGEWKNARCPEEGLEGFLEDYNIEVIREDKKYKYPHYFKNIGKLKWLDVYQVCRLFPVKDDSGAINHARKKLLVCGGRGGGKDMLKDIKEARDTLNRYLEIEGHLDD